MSSQHIFLIVTVIASLLVRNSYEQCLCNVEENGEYCGTELNQLNRNSGCERHIYYCGKSNRNEAAVLLKLCAEGSECDVSSWGRNACLRNIRCQCGPQLRRGAYYCGNQLNGDDCGQNVVFRCPYLRMFHPIPYDSCANGCVNGTCIGTGGVDVAVTTEQTSETVISEK